MGAVAVAAAVGSPRSSIAAEVERPPAEHAARRQAQRARIATAAAQSACPALLRLPAPQPPAAEEDVLAEELSPASTLACVGNIAPASHRRAPAAPCSTSPGEGRIERSFSSMAYSRRVAAVALASRKMASRPSVYADTQFARRAKACPAAGAVNQPRWWRQGDTAAQRGGTEARRHARGTREAAEKGVKREGEAKGEEMVTSALRRAGHHSRNERHNVLKSIFRTM
jgi:hypothetical protein